MDKPNDLKVKIDSITPADKAVKAVSLLGYEGEIEWSQDETGLSVTLPETDLVYAYGLKVE